MGNFLKAASKQVSDVRAFLRASASGNSIKYVSEKGAKHVIYFPFVNQEVIDEESGQTVVVKNLCAISGDIHEWTTPDGKFKATACLKGVVVKGEDGELINDGTCPICDRISAGWDIYNYRKEQEESNCKLTGENRKTYLEKTFGTFRDERKAKEARPYMYVLAVKFRTSENGAEILGQDNLPEYELKVMKLSSSRVEKLQQQVSNCGAQFAGSEIIFEYPNTDDRRLLVSQSTTTPVFPNNMLTVKYPAVLNKINEDVCKFEWDGIDKSFPEWSGMSVAEAKSIMNSMFDKWDNYLVDKKTNAGAKYLEYVVEAPSAMPSLGGAEIPSIPTMDANGPVVPNLGPLVAPDPNAVFGGGTTPSITV